MTARQRRALAGIGAVNLMIIFVRWLRRNYLVVVVTGHSMASAYRNGDRVLVRRVPITAICSGQIIVFTSTRDGAAKQTDHTVSGGRKAPMPRDRPTRSVRPRREFMIKQVSAVPGDPVPRNQFPALREVADSIVPSGNLVVIGTSADSYDSRHFGYVSGDRVIGVVERRLWSAYPAPPADTAPRSNELPLM